jgi:hypothetical protein
MMDTTARRFRVTIFEDEADTVGVDVSALVEEDIAHQRSLFEMESPISCNAEFVLVGNSDGSDGINLDPDTSTVIRPGAPVLFEYRNDAGTWRLVPWGARQVIRFAKAIRPDAIDPGQPWDVWRVRIRCQQTLKQQQELEAAFDAEYGTTAPGRFTTEEQLGAFRDYTVLATRICTAKDLNFAPQSGDPTPTFEYNTVINYDPRTADSALAFLHKFIYCNPDTSGQAYYLWQDNQQRVRIGRANLTTTRVSGDTLLNARWEPYSEDLISFKPVEEESQQMPGKLRVTAVARFSVRKRNPLISVTRSPADGATDPTQIQEAYSYDYNSWAGAIRTLITRTTVPKRQIIEGATGSVMLERVVTEKQYDLLSGRRLSRVLILRFGPRHLADESESTEELLLTREEQVYSYNSDGTLSSVRTIKSAVPTLAQIEADENERLQQKGISATIDQLTSGGGKEWAKTKFRAYNLDRQSDLIAYQPVSNANTPDARPQATETQENPWYTKEVPIFRDRVLNYNGIPVSKRVKTVDVGAFVFGGQRFNQLADNLALREAGEYSQYTIKFPLTDAIANAWEKPGLGLIVYDYLSDKTKVFGSFGGETIVFGRDTVECLVNAEYIGTIEDGAMVTPGEIVRVTLDGQVRVTLDDIARVV